VPCFDEPSFKARWRVAVTARAGDTVLGNAPIEREEPAGDGSRTVRLAQTPPLDPDTQLTIEIQPKRIWE